jgi:hypothetical protein
MNQAGPLLRNFTFFLAAGYLIGSSVREYKSYKFIDKLEVRMKRDEDRWKHWKDRWLQTLPKEKQIKKPAFNHKRSAEHVPPIPPRCISPVVITSKLM